MAERWRIGASSRHRAGVVLVVVCCALAYLLPFRAYGLNVEDEGTLLYQILRVVRGELPYVDFSTGYTPGFFALNALGWSLTGDLPTFRLLLALVHAVTAAGLAGLLAGLARPWIAVTLPLLYLAFIPVYPGEFCAFNIAYPAWFATAGWLATAGAVVAFTRGHRRRWLVAAGVAAAVTLAMKPNAGVFAFAAAAAGILAADSTGSGTGGRAVAALWLVVFVGILLGVLVVFGIVPRPLDAIVYLVPLAVVMAAIVAPSRMGRARAFGDLVALSVPFLALSAPWLAFFWQRLGTDGFLREVLLIGSGAADIYYVPFPRPEPWGLLLTILAASYAVAARFALRWVMPRATFAMVVAAVVAAVVAVAQLGVMPEGLLWSMIWQLQSAAFTLTLAAHATGAAWMWRRRSMTGAAGRAEDAVASVVLLFATFMFLQLYPRADFMHLLIAAPLSLVFAGFLLEHVLRTWEHALAARHRHALRGVVVGTAAAIVAAIVVGLLPGAEVLRGGDRFVLPFPVAPVGVEVARADDLRAVAAAAATLGHDLPAGYASVGFPSIDLLLFLTDGRNPTPHDYFFPGRPDHREEAEIVDTLADAHPATLAALNRQFTFFDASQAYYFLLRRFVRGRYHLVERAGRFDVLASAPRTAPTPVTSPTPLAMPFPDALRVAAGRGPVATRLEAIAALASHPVDTAVSALLVAAGDTDASVRRAAVRTLLDGLAASPERGLEDYVGASGLDRRSRILLLRTIRDLRDPRAASLLFIEVASGDPRIARDALGAMKVTRAQMVARAWLWSGPELPSRWPGRAALTRAVQATLGDANAAPEASAFAAEVAGFLADASTVEPLRSRLRSGIPSVVGSEPADAATAASAASSLVRFAPYPGLACELTALLARADAPIGELVPSALVTLAESGPSLRREVLACLDAAISHRTEAAVWVSAALGDGALAGALRTALGSDVSAMRRAAAWTLGELPADGASATALDGVAERDGDEIVRRLARRAYSKQTGAVARSLQGAQVSAFSRQGVAG